MSAKDEPSIKEIKTIHSTKPPSQIISMSEINSTSSETQTSGFQHTTKHKNSRVDGCSIFLRNTYLMISTCDRIYRNIAKWSDDGKYFVILDSENLASKIIPKFFRHNKFASFVRQLNFYGFRKIRNDIRIFPVKENIDHKIWRFRHEKFLRDRPDLLIEIRKPRPSLGFDPEELQKLKSELKGLKSNISSMSNELETIRSTIRKLLILTNEIDNKTPEVSQAINIFEDGNANHSNEREKSMFDLRSNGLKSILPHLMNLNIEPQKNVSLKTNDNIIDTFDTALTELGPISPDHLFTEIDCCKTFIKPSKEYIDNCVKKEHKKDLSDIIESSTITVSSQCSSNKAFSESGTSGMHLKSQNYTLSTLSIDEKQSQEFLHINKDESEQSPATFSCNESSTMAMPLKDSLQGADISMTESEKSYNELPISGIEGKSFPIKDYPKKINNICSKKQIDIFSALSSKASAQTKRKVKRQRVNIYAKSA